MGKDHTPVITATLGLDFNFLIAAIVDYAVV